MFFKKIMKQVSALFKIDFFEWEQWGAYKNVMHVFQGVYQDYSGEKKKIRWEDYGSKGN